MRRTTGEVCERFVRGLCKGHPSGFFFVFFSFSFRSSSKVLSSVSLGRSNLSSQTVTLMDHLHSSARNVF